MNYTKSIQRILAAQAHYNLMCDTAETDNAIGAALDIFHRAKADHRAAFGSLVRVNGAWI